MNWVEANVNEWISPIGIATNLLSHATTRLHDSGLLYPVISVRWKQRSAA